MLTLFLMFHSILKSSIIFYDLFKVISFLAASTSIKQGNILYIHTSKSYCILILSNFQNVFTLVKEAGLHLSTCHLKIGHSKRCIY